MGSFVFRWPHPDASDVHVTGTFDDWGKSVKLNKVGDIWEKEVELPSADTKILYKFVVDDNWVIDSQAPQEDDGHGNINNVLYPDKIKRKTETAPEAVTTSSAAPESTTAQLAGQVPLEPRREATEVTSGTVDSPTNKDTTESGLPGAFPETPQAQNEKTESESFSVNPLPATSGAGNPIDLPAGEKVPPPSEITSNSIYSSVTTSQDDYEKAGSSSLPFVGGIASMGAGLAGALGFGASEKKEEKKENLIPESSLPMGSEAGNTLDVGPTISSAGPTSTTAELAGKVPLEEKKPATVVEPESSVPEVVKESIEEAHVSPEAAASAEAVQEKAEVEQELLKKVPTADEAGEPAPAIAAATSATAPAPTSSTSKPSTQSGAVAGTAPSAAAALSDGAADTETPAVVSHSKVPAEKTEGDVTEYAPPHTTSTVAPGVSEAAAAAVSDGAEDPTLADEPAVQLMNRNETGQLSSESTQAPAGSTEPALAAGVTAATAPVTSEAPKTEATSGTVHSSTTEAPKTESAVPSSPAPKKEAAATPATPSSVTSTPTKQADTTPTSSPSAKDKKKKHRISSLFKKILH
ncbi:Cruciform DNA binding protein [Exophiala dermatitidis]|uniref:Cruciform DNA binding protein n=1 Tax=Exophiala dermatitidis TaxID=5970 RepID=A0AAN6ETB0_EXODE|nr:Cruciform DNA binding protein [Exophiala dermatitidis]KAJ4511097.1 Cruciform DNA binding protein [Exophiala dermatitidis]KAJ4511968.1 Cruciform DNA binding protein [Exophiala dermatitidis]KAJ4534831.1 Cruciform DNA binding protein [Exophiala dermatitidis]KAJ4545804.1 Cruciform DNA binding protein [Exophiala dermatitidis]